MTPDQIILVGEALHHAYELERAIVQAPVLPLHEYIRIMAVIARLEQLAETVKG